ncbi:MAG: hypothetical protein JXM70_05210 [Pirellulales bacterium]|nr:hypothetical protein [Pirellulales bacterium]
MIPSTGYSYEPLPAGKYLAEITSSETKTTKSGNGTLNCLGKLASDHLPIGAGVSQDRRGASRAIFDGKPEGVSLGNIEKPESVGPPEVYK